MRQRNRGFSLIELMVTLSVAVVLATLAAPSMTSFVTSMRLSSTSNQLYSDLNLARAEAIKRNTHVLACPSSNGTSCSTGTNWAIGWILCVDTNSDSACDVISNTTDSNYPNPFAARPVLDGSLTLTSTVNTITFKSDGTAVDATLTVTSTGSSRSKSVSIVKAGFISRT